MTCQVREHFGHSHSPRHRRRGFCARFYVASPRSHFIFRPFAYSSLMEEVVGARINFHFEQSLNQREKQYRRGSYRLESFVQHKIAADNF